MAQIEFWENINTITTSIHDVDVQEFAEWLEGEEPSLELLKEYLYETWNPVDVYDEYGETIDCGFDDEYSINKFLEEVRNEQAN